MNRQRLILTVLVVMFALAVTYSVIKFPRQKTADKPAAPRSSLATGIKNRVSGGEETRVRLDLLQKNQVGFTGYKKNIFAPIFRDLSKLPPVKPVTAAPPPPPPPPVAPPPAESVAEQELAQFTFLGFLDKDRKKTIFLSRNKEIFLVKQGERIAGRYEASSITDETLTIKVVDGGSTEIIIPLMENKSLKANPQRPATPPPLTPQPGRAPRRPGGALPAPGGSSGGGTEPANE